MTDATPTDPENFDGAPKFDPEDYDNDDEECPECGDGDIQHSTSLEASHRELEAENKSLKAECEKAKGVIDKLMMGPGDRIVTAALKLVELDNMSPRSDGWFSAWRKWIDELKDALTRPAPPTTTEPQHYAPCPPPPAPSTPERVWESEVGLEVFVFVRLMEAKLKKINRRIQGKDGI